MMAKVLEGVRQNGFTRAEQLLYTKEGALFCCDQEQNRCIVKSWPQGRECSLKDGQECRDAMRTLAVLHSALHFPQLLQEFVISESLIKNTSLYKKFVFICYL